MAVTALHSVIMVFWKKTPLKSRGKALEQEKKNVIIITRWHGDILVMCCKVISSFVIFAVLDLRAGGCRP